MRQVNDGRFPDNSPVEVGTCTTRVATGIARKSGPGSPAV